MKIYQKRNNKENIIDYIFLIIIILLMLASIGYRIGKDMALQSKKSEIHFTQYDSFNN